MAVVAVALSGCAPKPDAAPPAAPAPVPVTVAAVAARTIQRSVTTVGTLTGFEEVILAPKADGRVLRVYADAGEYVSPGQRLLDLDATDFRLAAAEAREALSAELAKLGLTALPAGEFDVEAVPAVRRAAVAVTDTKRKFALKKDLLAKGAGSADEYDIAATELQLAEATKLQTITEIRAVAAAARLRQASLDVAEQRLRDCELTAPVPAYWPPMAMLVGPGFAPGRYAVAARMAAEGEMLRAMPDTKAFKLVQDFILKLRPAIPERYAPEVVLGLPADVRVEAYPNEVFPGRVERVGPTVDPLNLTFSIVITVPNPAGRLKVGGFAKADIRTRTATAKTVPAASLVVFAGVTKVFVINGDAAKAVEVTVGAREKDWVEVTGDIAPGDKVATGGLSQLVDGAIVRVRE